MDLYLFNVEHPALQPANDDSHTQWVRDYLRTEVEAMDTDAVWREGGAL